MASWYANDNFSLIEGYQDLTVSMHKRGFEAFTLAIPKTTLTKDGAFLSFRLKSSSDIELRIDYHDTNLSNLDEAQQIIFIPGDEKYHNVRILFPKTYQFSVPDQDSVAIIDKEASHLLFYVNPGKAYAGDLTMKEFFLGSIEDQEEFLSQRTMQVFPNPAHSRINIQIPTGEFHSLKLVDMSGREVMTQSLSQEIDGIAYLDIRQITKGIYMLRLEGKQYATSKMVWIN